MSRTTARSPGHLFITRGDLTKLACDAWLLPTDAAMSVEPHWVDPAWASPALGVTVVGDRLSVPVPAGWGDSILAKRMPSEAVRKNCTPILTCIGTVATDVEAYVKGVRAFVKSASSLKSAFDRSHLLLALPVVGTGRGGGRRNKDEILQEIIRELNRLAETEAVDLVLVTHDSAAFAAAQHVRKKPAANSFGPLSEALRKSASELGMMAARGDLVLFLGAGVGQGVGLPLWEGLLDELAVDAGLSTRAKLELRKMSFPDRAQVLDGQLGPASFRRKITERMSSQRYGLGHSLLASLPVKEVVTTNFDDLFETASRAAGVRTSILPYSSSRTRDRWVLKLHGSIHHDDIVMTRDDYLRLPNQRRALAGIVQAMLITRHMLFVGYSLSDPDFHDTAFAVRCAVRGGKRSRAGKPFGSALVTSTEKLHQELWKGEIKFISVGAGGKQRADAGRRVEILLDAILAEATTGSPYLLDATYDGLLVDTDKKLRQAILHLRSVARDAHDTAARSLVKGFLKSLGDKTPDRRREQ